MSTNLFLVLVLDLGEHSQEVPTNSLVKVTLLIEHSENVEEQVLVLLLLVLYTVFLLHNLAFVENQVVELLALNRNDLRTHVGMVWVGDSHLGWSECAVYQQLDELGSSAETE